MDPVEYCIFESQVGTITVVQRGGRIIRLGITKKGNREVRRELTKRYPGGTETERPFKGVRTLLDKYLKGQKVDLDIPVDISGETQFTQKVLRVLQGIPYGEVRSYLWVGKQIGYTMAARAIGQAVKRNPIPIIIPCHRVIREDGTIGGFSQGVNMKRKLLAIENVKLP